MPASPRRDCVSCAPACDRESPEGLSIQVFSVGVCSDLRARALFFQIRSFNRYVVRYVVRYVSASRASFGNTAEDLLNRSSLPLGSNSGSCLHQRSGNRHGGLPVGIEGWVNQCPVPLAIPIKMSMIGSRAAGRREGRSGVGPGLAPASTGDSQLFKPFRAFQGSPISSHLVRNIQAVDSRSSQAVRQEFGCSRTL